MTLIRLFILIAFLTLLTAFLVIFIPHKKDTTKYTMIVPTQGNFIQTQKIELTFDNDRDIAMAAISDTSVTSLLQNQNVILKDKDGNILPLGGKVAFIRNSPDLIDVLIALPKETDTELLSTEAHIITMDVNTLKLLPRNIVHDIETDTPYVWISEKVEDKYKFKKQPIEISYKNDFYIAPGTIIPKEARVLVNYDKDVREDKTFKAKTLVFAPPRYNPIYTAWLKYGEAKLLEDKEQMALNLENCLKRAQDQSEATIGNLSTTEGTQSCGHANEILSAEEIFANIGKEGASANSCGSNSCGY
ncbi:MAG: hypothetical protein AAF244_04480 [Pseudomonadota bacterium]